jgi:pimeloyl-ACP methyl ester carboxylesterase
MRDVTIMSGSSPICVRDHGGEGPPLLLLHGAGGNLAAMGSLPACLAERFRVIVPDLRGHGHTGGGPWDWDGVLDDLQGVVDAFGFARPFVAGLSLGGMLAALWAARHPDCPGAVSLDGNPPVSRVDQLDGLDDAAAELARLTELFDGMEAMMAAPLTDELRGAMEAGYRATARHHGADEELFAEAFRRSVVDDRLRPDADLTRRLRTAMNALDLMPVYRKVRCPLLLVLATTDMPEQVPFHDLYEAYRRHVRNRLSTLDNPWVTVVPLEGSSHAMHAERPGELATLIASWVDFVHCGQSGSAGTQRISNSHSE